MNNCETIKHIESYLESMMSIKNLKFAKKNYQDLKKELIKYGCYIDRPYCEYTLDQLDYAIKSINLKLRLLNK